MHLIGILRNFCQTLLSLALWVWEASISGDRESCTTVAMTRQEKPMVSLDVTKETSGKAMAVPDFFGVAAVVVLVVGITTTVAAPVFSTS